MLENCHLVLIYGLRPSQRGLAWQLAPQIASPADVSMLTWRLTSQDINFAEDDGVASNSAESLFRGR